jgi:hypothetical protein
MDCPTDIYSYRPKELELGKTLALAFCHHDLMPAETTQ